jgi:DNA-directed RNA polymerase subunit K/omega
MSNSINKKNMLGRDIDNEESDIDMDYNDNLDPDIYLDEDLDNNLDDILDSNGKRTLGDFPVNKNKMELDNDDNINDYINDNDEDEFDDPDLNDDDIYEDEIYDNIYSNEYTNEYTNEYEDNKNVNFKSNTQIYADNDYDQESKIQIIVKPEERITSNRLTIYELIELIGIRATQISQGSQIFTNVENILDPLDMAKKEIWDNKCPLSIKRYIGLDKYELWNPNDMVKPKI